MLTMLGAHSALNLAPFSRWTLLDKAAWAQYSYFEGLLFQRLNGWIGSGHDD